MTALAAMAMAMVMAGIPSQDGLAPNAAAPPAGKPAPGGKLAPAVGKEMADAIVAVNKALGLESWPAHGVKPCIDRGGQGILAKNVTADDTLKCATAAVGKGFSDLGKAYVLAILMSTDVGPVTVVALGTGENAGWGAYSCDPARACKPLKIDPATKWGKRIDERRGKACGDATTIWLPTGQRSCP
jgi:hypothetical protein